MLSPVHVGESTFPWLIKNEKWNCRELDRSLELKAKWFANYLRNCNGCSRWCCPAQRPVTPPTLRRCWGSHSFEFSPGRSPPESPRCREGAQDTSCTAYNHRWRSTWMKSKTNIQEGRRMITNLGVCSIVIWRVICNKNVNIAIEVIRLSECRLYI